MPIALLVFLSWNFISISLVVVVHHLSKAKSRRVYKIWSDVTHLKFEMPLLLLLFFCFVNLLILQCILWFMCGI